MSDSALAELRGILKKEEQHPQVLTEECSLFTSINVLSSAKRPTLSMISLGVLVQLFHLPEEAFAEAEMLSS